MSSPTARGQQREATKAKIATEAARLFGEQGFDRTSVRHVASAAGVDPALVLHYFGSKEQLFKFVAETKPARPMESPGGPLAAAISSLAEKLDQADPAFRARVRSMLTHPDAAESARDEITTRARSLGAMSSACDAELRVALALAMNLGVAIARDLLGVEILANASSDTVLALVRSALEQLLEAG